MTERTLIIRWFDKENEKNGYFRFEGVLFKIRVTEKNITIHNESVRDVPSDTFFFISESHNNNIEQFIEWAVHKYVKVGVLSKRITLIPTNIGCALNTIIYSFTPIEE